MNWHLGRLVIFLHFSPPGFRLLFILGKWKEFIIFSCKVFQLFIRVVRKKQHQPRPGLLEGEVETFTLALLWNNGFLIPRNVVFIAFIGLGDSSALCLQLWVHFPYFPASANRTTLLTTVVRLLERKVGPATLDRMLSDPALCFAICWDQNTTYWCPCVLTGKTVATKQCT